MIFLGFFVSMLSFVVGLAYLAAKLIFWYSLPIGVAPVLISIFFLGSIQLFALGVVGEYIGLLLNYSRQFPLVHREGENKFRLTPWFADPRPMARRQEIRARRRAAKSLVLQQFPATPLRRARAFATITR